MSVDCPPLPQPVYVDRGQWEKIVSNLLSNAFKFTFHGEISVRLRQRSEHVELQVSDTGTGIATAELPRIFERFHRVDGARGRSFEGTGIGLALVKELVGLHGGTVHAKSVVDEGTTFTVSLPLGCAHLPQDRVAAEPSPERGSSIAPMVLEAKQWQASAPAAPLGEVDGTPRERILVVDDNADMRAYVVSLLSEHWTVSAVSDGNAALAHLETDTPGLILSDVMMPGLDGFGLVRALRASPATRNIPVILLSARAGEEAVVEGLDTGADDYILKPFSARELVTRVRARLDTARARTSALRASEARFQRLAESGMASLVGFASSPHAKSKRSRFITLFHAATKSWTNLSWASAEP